VVDHRLRVGRFRPLHRGVYRVGPVTGPRAREMAAVLACGESAAVSHRSAAVLWGMIPGGRVEAVEVIVARGRAGRRPGIRVRHVHTITREEVTVRDHVPITTAARTLYDLAGVASHRELERAVAEALALRLVDRARILALLDHHAARPGASRLRRLLDGDTPPRTRSEAEERFLALVRKACLRDPDANAEVAGYEVDFLWRAERLVVEVDGVAFHSSNRRFEGDRRRDAVLIGAGLRVMRVTWHQIVKEPEALLVRLAQALARPAQL